MQTLIRAQSFQSFLSTKKLHPQRRAGNSFQVLDAGDFSSVSQVYNIFDVILRVEEKKSEKEKIDDKLRMLLNNKMSGIWKKEDEELFENVKNENLTKVQKLIMRQIEEWKL